MLVITRYCPFPPSLILDFRHLLQGECRSNVPDDGRNAVTWGVFSGKEITQTTIIERESFLSWKVCTVFFYFQGYEKLTLVIG